MAANDYLKTYKSLNKELLRLKIDVNEKLVEMCKKYPDAPIVKTSDNVIIKAGSLHKNYLTDLNFELQIRYIQEIEKFIENKLPRQLKIPFNSSYINQSI